MIHRRRRQAPPPRPTDPPRVEEIEDDPGMDHGLLDVMRTLTRNQRALERRLERIETAVRRQTSRPRS